MGMLGRLRAATPAPDSDVWYRPVGYAMPTVSGISVSPETAMTLSAVWQAVRIVWEGIAGLPCLTYRRLPTGGKERAPNHPLYDLLRWQPNVWQTAFEFWEMVVGHSAGRGARAWDGRSLHRPPRRAILRAQ